MECIAHRGSAFRVPENSLAGIKYTAMMDIKQIECDISVASDDIAVIFHDESLRRMTGDPRSVLSVSSEELGMIPLISPFRSATQYIPKALDWMQEASRHDLFVHLEIKVHDQEFQRAVDAALTAFDGSGLKSDHVRFSSFSLEALKYLSSIRPELSLGLAASQYPEIADQSIEELDLKSMHLQAEFVTREHLQAVEERGLTVCLYTVNELSILGDLPRQAIEAVFTDDPVALRDAITTLKF
ncbi:glycerophosphodiester phosphodiesterase family protein [Litorivicinus sp.]|jgi:glycerophosphoryl diester phosphodiesterase|nr:glycerophosphodiester phosphodiesterase family protein [Litorivicinus sp.]